MSLNSTHGPCSRSETTVVCDLGGILAGTQAVVNLELIPTATGLASASANFTTTSTDTDSSDNSASAKSAVVPAEGLFTPAAKMSEPRTGHTATLLTGPGCTGVSVPPWCGKVLIVGPDSWEIYNPALNEWSETGSHANHGVD
ncbi:MAG: hypothetical protein ACRDIU_08965, partial [Actinomycetota bacterium]